MILRETLVLAVTGLIAGLPAAVGCSRLIAGMFYGITTSDPVTLIGVSLLLLSVAALSGLVPARRAMRLDPIATLHYE